MRTEESSRHFHRALSDEVFVGDDPFGPIELKPVFHFNRIVAKRSVFLCFLSTRVELMTSTQKKMPRYVTIEVENGLLSLSHPVTVI